MPPRITQNDKREQTGRIPNQLNRIQRETSTIAKTTKQLSQSKQGQMQFSANAQSAFRTDPNIATTLVNALRPAAQIVKAGVEVRDRIDKDKFEDIVLFAQNTNANADLGYQEKLKLIADAYNDFKPMSRKYQIAAHTQKTKAMQELNGIQDKLLFSNWSKETIQASMNFPINPEDGSMSRQEFLDLAAEDLRLDQPRFAVQSMVWQNSQQEIMYKKQFEMLNSFASLQADIILKSKEPGFFSSAGNENQFRAELETALKENGYDPRDILENEAIMEGIDNRYAAYKTTGNTVAAKRGAETTFVSDLVNSQVNDQNLPHFFGRGISPRKLSELIIEEGMPNAANPSIFINQIYSQLSSISNLEGKPTTQVVETLGAFPLLNYTDEDTQELVRKVREDPSYLDDMLKDPNKYKAVEKALSDTEMLMRQEFKTQLGIKGIGEFLNRPPIEDFSTPPVTEVNKVEDILNTINTDTGNPDDRVRQTDYVVSQAVYYSIALGSQQDFMQYDREGRGVGEPQFNKEYELQADAFNRRMEAADFRSQNPTEENIQARKSILEELDKNGLLMSVNDVDERTRFFSTALTQLSNGITIGGTVEQTGSRMLNGVVIAAGESGAYGNSQEFIESQEEYLKSSLEKFFRNMVGLDPLTAERIEFILDNHGDSFGAVTALEQLGNDMGNNPKDPNVMKSFSIFKTVYGNFVRDYARMVEQSTNGLITTTENSFKLGSNPSTMIPFLSGSVASRQAFDARSGSNISTVPLKAVEELSKQINGLSSQMAADMGGEDFNVEQFRLDNSRVFAAITQLYGNDMSSPALSSLRSSLVNFTGMYLGMPADLVNQISDPETKAPRNIILRDFLLDNGRMFTSLNETQRRGVSLVSEGFNSFFVDSSNNNPPISFSPDFRTVFEQSDIRQNTGQPESFALINNGFGLNIPTEKFTPLKGEAFPEISVELQSAFSNETVQTIVQGLLENHEIRARFLEDSSLTSALQNSVLNVIGVTEGRNKQTTLAGSATDLLLSNLQQTNQRLAISIVRAEEGQGNPNVTAMVKASMEAGGADSDTLNNIGEFNFHTEVIQGTPNDKNRIQFVQFNPTEEEKFKSQFAEQGPLDPSIIRKNANLTRVSVPEFAFQKVMFNFNNLFNTPEGNKFLTPLEGSTPEPYKDIVKILATEMGEGELVGGRRYTENGKEYIESGMSLFGLNQISVLYQATKAIVEAKGTDAGLQFLKEIHDRYQRTDNEGDKPSVFAYVNNEGEFLYMAENEQTPVFLGGENRSIIQQETQDFIDNILFTTSRTDIPVSQLGGSRYNNFRTYNERKKQEKAKEELRKYNMMSRGGYIPS